MALLKPPRWGPKGQSPLVAGDSEGASTWRPLWSWGVRGAGRSPPQRKDILIPSILMKTFGHTSCAFGTQTVKLSGPPRLNGRARPYPDPD